MAEFDAEEARMFLYGWATDLTDEQVSAMSDADLVEAAETRYDQVSL